MSVFFEIKNSRINIEKITDITIESDDFVIITFDNESTESYCVGNGAKSCIERLEKTIVQVIPCSVPMYNIYKDDNGEHFHERVLALALCADGIVRSLACEEYIDLAEDSRNFIGCFLEGRLVDFPKCKASEQNDI